MRQVFAYEKSEDFKKYKGITARLFDRLKSYKSLLEDEYKLIEPPKGIIWTSKDIAVNVFSDVPVPAYTSRDVIFMTPNVTEWQAVMFSQLEGTYTPEIEAAYNDFDETDVLIILAHELTHHLDLFPDVHSENAGGIWFEEGMCEYLPRRMILNPDRFQQDVKLHERRVELFSKYKTGYSLETFGPGSYNGSMSSIMYHYWRSFLAVKYIVEKLYDGDIKTVFEVYNDWHVNHSHIPFSRHIGIEK